MEKLVESLLKSLENGNWIIAVIIVSIVVILNLKSIQEFLYQQNRRHEEFIKDALKIEALNEATKSALTEQLNYIVYKRVTGIAADDHLRSKIHALIEESQGELRTSDFTKAQKFIQVLDNRASIVITKWDKAENWFNKISAGIMTILAVVTIFLTTAIPEITLLQVLALTAIASMIFAFALFLVAQIIPMAVAKRIAPVIERLETGRAALAPR